MNKARTTKLLKSTASIAFKAGILCTVAAIFLIQSKVFIFSQLLKHSTEAVDPFPVSVNINTKTIVEDPYFTQFYDETLAQTIAHNNSIFAKVGAVLMDEGWYQNLASPVSRIIVVWPGERKEEAAKNIANVLGWNQAQMTEFESLIGNLPPQLSEGTLFPGQYIAHKEASPADIAGVISDSYQSEVLARYTPTVAAQVPLEDALIIASLIEREASDFTNMREVSGVIWNRLFIDMPLQLDATLQYVKGSSPYVSSWWPIIRPDDKYLQSPFNTYQNAGLPPAPIANPSVEAIVAALNPIATDCIFYFHTANGTYECSTSYDEHVSKLRSLYGRGS